MLATIMEQEADISPIFNSVLFNSTPVSPVLAMSVILPVRNEAENLQRTLDALRNQCDQNGNQFPFSQYEILLLANNCTDESVEIALQYQSQYPDFNLFVEEINISKQFAHIGTVRRLLMDAAYNRFEYLNKPSGIIASTDSDSEVDKFWIFNTIKEISSGNDVVGGRILTRPDNSMARIYYLRDITYKYLVSKVESLLDPVVNDPWPRHFQCFGASFAVTCQIYDLSGRLPVVPFLEDMAFHKALSRIDAKIRLSPLVKVFTSTRIQGRVDFGFSIQLKQWGEMNQAHHPVMVERAEALLIKLKARKLLRQYWTGNNENTQSCPHLLGVLASSLMLDEEWIHAQVCKAPYFGLLWEGLEEKLETGPWSERWPKKDVVHVIPDLKRNIIELQEYQKTG